MLNSDEGKMTISLYIGRSTCCAPGLRPSASAYLGLARFLGAFGWLGRPFKTSRHDLGGPALDVATVSELAWAACLSAPSLFHLKSCAASRVRYPLANLHDTDL